MKLLLLIATILMIQSCSSDPKPALVDKVVKKKIEEPWNYYSKEDKMTGGKTNFAEVTATELLQFKFPYNGGSTAYLSLRKKEGDLDVLLSISKGQFISDLDGGEIRVKFDSIPAKKYSVSRPSDGSSESLFIRNEKDFVKHLKRSSKTIIEVQFYDEGLRQIEFNTRGLKWE